MSHTQAQLRRNRTVARLSRRGEEGDKIKETWTWVRRRPRCARSSPPALGFADYGGLPRRGAMQAGIPKTCWSRGIRWYVGAISPPSQAIDAGL